jgi:ribosomal protein L40E
MSDDTNTPQKPEFEIDQPRGHNAQLFECMRCGTTLSTSSRVCRVCGAELSGGEWQHPHHPDEATEE